MTGSQIYRDKQFQLIRVSLIAARRIAINLNLFNWMETGEHKYCQGSIVQSAQKELGSKNTAWPGHTRRARFNYVTAVAGSLQCDVLRVMCAPLCNVLIQIHTALFALRQNKYV